MSDPLEELGVAGYLDEVALTQLGEIDVDAVYSIGLAGPMTRELLLRINDLGAQRVAEFAHEVASGPFDPMDFELLLDVGMDEVRQALWTRGLVAADPADVVAAIRQEFRR